MPTISISQQQAIQRIVGPDRARFDKRERRVYSHDTGVLPGPFQILAGASLADGVVQPETEDQLVELVRFALAEGIPLVPRGKATSGYGGAIPARGGLVLDLRAGMVCNTNCGDDRWPMGITSADSTRFHDLPATGSAIG